ncbi:type VI secretion system membrane subunit TssM [Siccibacter colletis]|uniref:type VI secretion system membrane subunit TssM n=1 Tax=Siccibacter colletis TaxID=1505757 RepID=UPI0028BDC09E|nr:type VI secretion system membrane subunit TssM [Siccibacter colletis]WNN47909.1 type VI secretion system membrane subunit TssM [Siccibacter colletis]
MFYLNRLFSGRSLKTILLFACFIVLVAAIWYLGPFTGFGKTRPLQSVHARVAFILLTALWLARFFWRIPFFVLGAVSLCVLVWEIGPFILIGNQWPLTSVVRRLTIMAIIAFITLMYAGWLLILALSRNPHLLDDFHRLRKGKIRPASETLEVTGIIRKAALRTRQIRTAMPRWRRFFITSQDALPWYMVIGNENAGKTSLIVASGQEFPLPEQLARTSDKNAPTAHCECWFANDALFVDTAGKYVGGESSVQPEWNGILNAIRKYRPINAINGAIVAISATDVMGASQAALRDIGAQLRSRLTEMRTTLGVRFPVYVIVTRMDRLAGFEAYFRDLTAEGRDQIWGVTFPYGEKTNASLAEEHIGHELGLLASRIDASIAQRQQEEYAVSERRKMYALSQDFCALAEDLTRVLQSVFFASRYDETQFYSTLRGVYFSSACQHNETPLANPGTLMQRWRRALAGQQHETLSATESGDELLISRWNGRHYFLRQLFAEVIIKDAGLVRYNLQAASRNRLVNLCGHALSLALAFFLFKGIVTSFGLNDGYLDSVDDRLSVLEYNASRFVTTKNDALVAALLALSQGLPQMSQQDVSAPSLPWRYGLYTGFHMVEQATGLYQALLHQLLLPQIEQQTTQALREATAGSDTDRLYDALRLYLMVFGEGKFDRNIVEDGLAARWESTGKMDAYETSAVFIDHLRRLFGPGDWRQYGQPADPELISEARRMLARQSPEERVYQQVKTLLNREAPPNLTLATLSGEEGGPVFTLDDDTLRDEGIPGLFTHEGYYEVVKKKGLPLVATFATENGWVMGQPVSAAQEMSLYSKVLGRYLRDYTSYWSRFLSDVHLAYTREPSQDFSSGMSVDLWLLRTLASSPSPLTRFAREVARQTTLSEEGETLDEVLNVTHRSQTLSRMKKFDALMARQEKRLVRAGVDEHFSGLHDFVRGGGATGGVTPLNRMMALLNEQYTMLVISKNALAEGDTPPVSEEGKKLLAEAQTWPDPFREMVEPLLASALDSVEAQQVIVNNDAIGSGLGTVCRATLEGKFPFADVEPEVSLSAFTRFFAAGGLVDAYFAKNLASKVDTSSSPWRYKGTTETEGLAVFEQAAAIRDAFFQQDEGRKLSLDLAVTVPHLSPGLLQLTLAMGGEKFKYAHGPVTPFYVKWPGPRPDIGLFATAVTASAQEAPTALSRLQVKGAWALFRLRDNARAVDSSGESDVLSFDLDKHRVDLDIAGLRYGDVSLVELLQNFQCPGDR